MEVIKRYENGKIDQGNCEILKTGKEKFIFIRIALLIFISNFWIHDAKLKSLIINNY